MTSHETTTQSADSDPIANLMRMRALQGQDEWVRSVNRERALLNGSDESGNVPVDVDRYAGKSAFMIGHEAVDAVIEHAQR